jgi:hypothetical protein
MSSHNVPRSKRELLARARHEARVTLGRAAFVRDARVLPLGVPIALGLAALAYSRAVRTRHTWPRDWRHPITSRRRRQSEALGVAAAALGGAVALAYLEARLEWTLRERRWRELD